MATGLHFLQPFCKQNVTCNKQILQQNHRHTSNRSILVQIPNIINTPKALNQQLCSFYRNNDRLGNTLEFENQRYLNTYEIHLIFSVTLIQGFSMHQIHYFYQIQELGNRRSESQQNRYPLFVVYYYYYCVLYYYYYYYYYCHLLTYIYISRLTCVYTLHITSHLKSSLKSRHRQQISQNNFKS